MQKFVKQNIGTVLCIIHGIRYFWKVYYRWNINGTYKMNQNVQNGIISELYTDDKNQNILETLIIFLSQLKTFMKSFI